MHMIFDIKMDGKLTRNAIFVADGHTTELPSSIKYSIFGPGRVLGFYFYLHT